MTYCSVDALDLHAADGQLHIQGTPSVHSPPVWGAPHQVTGHHLQGQPSLTPQITVASRNQRAWGGGGGCSRLELSLTCWVCDVRFEIEPGWCTQNLALNAFKSTVHCAGSTNCGVCSEGDASAIRCLLQKLLRQPKTSCFACCACCACWPAVGCQGCCRASASRSLNCAMHSQARDIAVRMMETTPGTWHRAGQCF